jgi:hypothetical protein
MDAVRFITQESIDKTRWNDCVAASSNGSVYAYSFWLDAMTTAWDGLVWGDYVAVMPLPHRRKWGLQYLYQPPLTAQLGLIGDSIDAKLFNAFLKAIPSQFRYIDMPLNRDNVFAEPLYPIYTRTNYILPLHEPYAKLRKGYRENIRRNCKKAEAAGCRVEQNIPLEAILSLTQPHLYASSDLQLFAKLYPGLKQKGVAQSFGIYSPEGSLISGVVFVYSHQRAYYLIAGNSPEGRSIGASHLLIDSVIRLYAGTDLILDFEGSDVSSLAHYYSGFGAVIELYSAIRINKLPRPLRWLKD